MYRDRLADLPDGEQFVAIVDEVHALRDPATLYDQGLLRKIGPDDHSGLYEIAPAGVAALNNRALHGDGERKFTRTVTEEAEDIRIEPPTVHGPESSTHD